MAYPVNRWAEVLLYVIGPLKPEQLTALFAHVAQTVRELSARQDGVPYIFIDEGRLYKLAAYCSMHGIPRESHDYFTVCHMERTASLNGCLRSRRPPYAKIFCDAHILNSYAARVADVQCLFYDGSVPKACRQALILRDLRWRKRLETILVPI